MNLQNQWLSSEMADDRQCKQIQSDTGRKKSELHTENEGLELTISTQEDQERPGQAEYIFLYK